MSAGAHREDLAKVATAMANGAYWTFAAMLVALVAEVVFGPMAWPVAVVALALLIACVRRANASFCLGALTLTPLLWVKVDDTIDALVAWDPYWWWTTFCAWWLTFLWLLVARYFLRLGSVVVAALKERTRILWRAAALSAVGVAAVGSVVAIASEPGPGIEEWRAFVERVTAPGALTNERATVTASPEARIAIAAPTLVRGATVVRVTGPSASDAWLRADGRGRPNDSLPRFLRSCLVPPDGAAVLLETRAGPALVPLHDPEHGGCALVGQGPVRMTNAGFDGPLGSPRAAAWSMLLALGVGLVLVVIAERNRRRARWIVGLVEAMPLRDSDGSGTTARLGSGDIVRLAGASAIAASSVLVAAPRPGEQMASYRLDAGPPIVDWMPLETTQEGAVASELQRAETLDAFAVVSTVWVLVPAIVAWSYGFVVSPW